MEGVHREKDDDIVYGYDLILEKISELGIREIEPRSDSRLY